MLALKGFRSPDQARPHLELLAGLDAEHLFFADTGLDLGTYLATAARLRENRYCFLNSYSLPLIEGWLAKLDDALRLPNVGAVGVTGSWSSSRSWNAYALGLPSAYDGALPPPSEVRRQMRVLMSLQRDAATPRREAFRARALALRLLLEQERFPAYSLRTNGFMVSHETLRRLRAPQINGRSDSLALESGKNSITRQLERLGLRTLVVDRDGTTFDREDWHRSSTFCQSDQQDLLVADNRTLMYERGDLGLRRVLAGLSWGPYARL